MIACGPKVADKATAYAFEKDILKITEDFTRETTSLYNDTGEILKRVRSTGGKIELSDSVKIFRQLNKCNSIINVTLDKLSAVKETEEILNFDNGQLIKLTTNYVTETKEQINGPLIELIRLYSSSKRDSRFDSLSVKHAGEYVKQKELIRGITASILMLPYYQDN